MFHVGQNIRTVRKFTGLNQKDFSEKFGIIGRNGKPSEDLLSTYERQITPPPYELLKMIAQSVRIDYKKFISEPIKIEDLKEIEYPPFMNPQVVGRLSGKLDPEQMIKEPDQNYALHEKIDFLERVIRENEKSIAEKDRQIADQRVIIDDLKEQLSRFKGKDDGRAIASM